MNLLRNVDRILRRSNVLVVYFFFKKTLLAGTEQIVPLGRRNAFLYSEVPPSCCFSIGIFVLLNPFKIRNP